jgi:dihydroxyacetone kinase phosphotransfer subunit
LVGIVIVAHSRELAEALKRFAAHVVHRELPIAAAGGVDDAQNPYGTDAMAIRDAVHSVIGGDGVVVLMDMGSSLLSAEVALDFLPEELRGRVRLCGAPLVEGVIAAGVRRGAGAARGR